MSTLRLLTSSSEGQGTGDVGLLFESASDSSARLQHPGALSLHELIGSFDEAKLAAFGLARALLSDEPRFRGLGHLGIFEESVIRELQQFIHAKWLVESLVRRGIRTCTYAQPSRLVEDARSIADIAGATIRFVAKDHSPSVVAGGSPLRRAWRRLQDARFSSDAILAEGRLVLREIDPYHRLNRLRSPAPSHRKHEIWFYSTAETFTRIGMAYEPHFPSRLEYLVENPATGGVPLASAGRAFVSPYSYARRADEPSTREVNRARAEIGAHVAKARIAPEHEVVRQAYLGSQSLRAFFGRLLPEGLLMSRAFERFIDVVSPRAIVVGNPGFEGLLLGPARHAGIPTILLQHGILGDFCQFVDPPVDHYVVRGTFWREFLAPAARSRAMVANPIKTPPHAAKGGGARSTVVFLTAPYSLPFWDEAELKEILATLVSSTTAAGGKLAVRVHPRERVEKYEQMVEEVARESPGRSGVVFSQGPGLNELLEKAAVAVTYSSTVFLDCLRHRVPIVSLGWHDFAYKGLIEKHGVFGFCSGMTELGALVTDGLGGRLTPFAGDVEQFEETNSQESVRLALEMATHA